MGLLDTPLMHSVRRNHAVEHATIHVLTERHGAIALAGRADRKGFHLYGRVSTKEVVSAVEEALRRLPREPGLAVHPRCGTNLVVSGIVAGMASFGAVASLPPQRRSRAILEVLPRLLLAGTAAALVSQALGPEVQRRYTTDPGVDGVRLAGIQRKKRGAAVIHRVLLAPRGDAGA